MNTPQDRGPSDPHVPDGPWLASYRSQGDGAEADPPPSLRAAVRLMYVGAAMSAIGSLVALLQRDEVRERILENRPSLTDEELDAAVRAGTAIGVVFGLVVVGLWIWMARTNLSGKRWARVVATVLGSLSILSLLVSLAVGESTGLANLLGVVQIGLAVTILFLLYQSDSTEYYDARST